MNRFAFQFSKNCHLGMVFIAICVVFGEISHASETEGTTLQPQADVSVDVATAEAFRSQLQAIRISSATPQEIVSRTAALLKTRPRLRAQSTDALPKELPAPAPNLSEDDTLRVQARNALYEIRTSSASLPQKMALMAEFRRQNAETLASLRPRPPTAAQREAYQQSEAASLRAQLAIKPSDVFAQARSALFDLRSQSATPLEIVARTVAFLKLNEATLRQAYKSRVASTLSNTANP